MYSPNLTFSSSDQFRACGMSINSQAHNCYELVYFHKASGVLTLGDATYPLRNGTIYIAFPDTLHSEIHTGYGLTLCLCEYTIHIKYHFACHLACVDIFFLEYHGSIQGFEFTDVFNRVRNISRKSR